MGVLTQILWYGSARQASGRAIVSPSCLLLTADTGTSFASVIFFFKKKKGRLGGGTLTFSGKVDLRSEK